MAQDKNGAAPFDPSSVGYVPQLGADFLDPLGLVDEGADPKEDREDPAVPFNLLEEIEEGDDKRDTSPKPNGKDQPANAKADGEDPDDGDGQDEELGELDEFLAKHGFKTAKDLTENWDEQKKALPEAMRMINDLQQRLNERDQYIHQLITSGRQTESTPPEQKIELPTGEKLTELIAEKPEKFVELLTSQITSAFAGSPQMKQIRDGLEALSKGHQENQAKDVLYNLRTAFSDFGDFEQEVNKTLHAIGRDGLAGTNSQPLLTVLYEHAKMKAFIPELINHVRKMQQGNEEVDEQAKKLAKTVKGGPQHRKIVPGKGDEPGKRTFKTRAGTLKAEDLDLLFDPAMSSLATIPAKPYF